MSVFLKRLDAYVCPMLEKPKYSRKTGRRISDGCGVYSCAVCDRHVRKTGEKPNVPVHLPNPFAETDYVKA